MSCNIIHSHSTVNIELWQRTNDAWLYNIIQTTLRHQAQQGRHNNCKDPYHSWYHKHLEDLAEQFDVKLEANDMTWITAVKKKVHQQWYTTWLQAMQQNDSTWSTIYIIFKQQPVMESYMKALVHPVTIALHKLRSSHFPFQHHIGRINHTHKM